MEKIGERIGCKFVKYIKDVKIKAISFTNVVVLIYLKVSMLVYL